MDGYHRYFLNIRLAESKDTAMPALCIASLLSGHLDSALPNIEYNFLTIFRLMHSQRQGIHAPLASTAIFRLCVLSVRQAIGKGEYTRLCTHWNAIQDAKYAENHGGLSHDTMIYMCTPPWSSNEAIHQRRNSPSWRILRYRTLHNRQNR